MSPGAKLGVLGWLVWDTLRQALASAIVWVMLGLSVVTILVCVSIRVVGDYREQLPGTFVIPASDPESSKTYGSDTEVVGGEMHIGVLDAGVGLPEDVESLFRPFHSTKPHGLGMGLSICRSLVGAHRGRLWAEPRPGGGAAFRIALPLA